MRTKWIRSLAVGALLAVASAAGMVIDAPDAASAPRIPFPTRPCIAAAGLCLRTSSETNTTDTRGGSTGSTTPSPPPSDGGGGDDDGGGGTRQPTPEEIARQIQQELQAEAETFLPQPEVATNPGNGRPSIIDVPTFFEVTNWLPRQVDHYARGVWWITVTATPSLSLDPGEPGARTIPCEDGGTRYDPGGPSPREQATRRGACAYSYTRRTGAAGRPDAWTARLMVSWSIEWEANFPLDDVPSTFEVLTGTVERQVDEVQTVVNR